MEAVFTVVAFGSTVVLLPVVSLSYVLVRMSNYVWHRAVSFLHPNLEFIKNPTVRTLTDTHRNQGVVAVLLTIKGPVNYEAVYHYLEVLVQQTDKFGNILYPRLTQCLVARFGTYAWQTSNVFDLTNNLITAPGSYKGRPISEYNIQECVGEIVSKYLPAGFPPWQMVLIPSTDNQHFLLLRLHHVLLGEEISIGDLLPLKDLPKISVQSHNQHSPLRDVFTPPEHIFRLKDRLTEDFTNTWNEFVASYDPLEKPELLKTTPGYFEYLGILLITTVSIWKEYCKDRMLIKNNPLSILQFFMCLVDRESNKRKVSMANFVKSFFVTFEPVNLLSCLVHFTWKTTVCSVLRLPLTVYRELQALHTCLTLEYCVHPNTLVGFLYTYVPLVFKASKESIQYMSALAKAPKNLFDEILSTPEIIQTVTLCGRKVVAWSKPVKMEYIREIAKASNANETEIVLSAASAGIARYFRKLQDRAPGKIAITARSFDSNFIFNKNSKLESAMGGLICLDLPILDYKRSDHLENLTDIKRILRRALKKQNVTYLLSALQTKYSILSKLFPATYVGILLRGLSLKYSVSYSEIAAKHPHLGELTTWGQEVVGALYFRPPQANISISLCLNQYMDYAVLAVMSDAQLVPHHSALVRNFPEDLEEIAEAAGL